MPPIQSPQNPQLKHLAKILTATKHRREHRQAALEGAHLLAAYLDAGNTPQQVYIPEPKLRQPETATLAARLPENRITPVAPHLLQKISSLDHADDIISLIALPCPAPPAREDCIVLDAVQDAGNVGTVLRSAAAAGIHHVVLGAGCADAYSPKVLRAGMGAHFALTLHERVDLRDWLAGYPHHPHGFSATKAAACRQTSLPPPMPRSKSPCKARWNRSTSPKPPPSACLNKCGNAWQPEKPNL